MEEYNDKNDPSLLPLAFFLLMLDEMDILWDPERGTCTECGQIAGMVRRFTSGDRHYVFCHACWNDAVKLPLGIVEWLEDDQIVIEYEDEPSQDGTTQRAYCN
jgi:hypothetical protein